VKSDGAVLRSRGDLQLPTVNRVVDGDKLLVAHYLVVYAALVAATDAEGSQKEGKEHCYLNITSHS